MGKECSTWSWCSRSWFANVVFPPQSGGGSRVLETAKRGTELAWVGAEDSGESGAARVGLTGITYLCLLLAVQFDRRPVLPAFLPVCT